MTRKEDIQEILFCVAKCREQVSSGLVIEILQGSHSVRVFSRRLNQNSAFGSMKGRSTEELSGVIHEMIESGLVEETEDEYPRLILTDAGHKMLHE